MTRGSRNSRKKKAIANANANSSCSNDMARQVLIDWMDEIIRYDRQERERIAAWVTAARQEQADLQFRIDEKRKLRKLIRSKRIAANRRRIQRERQQVSRDRLKITGLPVRSLGTADGTGAAYRETLRDNGKLELVRID